jgi:hypothetical protein
MGKSIMWLMVALVFFCPIEVSAQQANQLDGTIELSETDKRILTTRIDQIMVKDQQFRSYLSFGTIDEAKIAKIQKLDAKGQLAAMAASKDELSDEVKKVMVELQRRNDRDNLIEFREIVKQYGYPSAERMGVKSDRLFAVLLHPHVDLADVEAHAKEMEEFLKPEVIAGRMKAKLYAAFVDNMLGKILRKPQLYGTNQQYDPVAKKVLPPVIEDLQRANDARREIGMPELKDGEYRLAQTAVTKS